MNRYYILRDGIFKDGAELLFYNNDTIYPLIKGEKIFYEDVEYTVISVDHYFKCNSGTVGRYEHRKIYLRRS